MSEILCQQNIDNSNFSTSGVPAKCIIAKEILLSRKLEAVFKN